MNISTKTRYGFRLMVYLGNNYASGEPIQLGSVAEEEGLSLKYLEKIAQSLKNAGLVNVKRGAKGGYNLSREARKITCLDMFTALEGSPSVVDCLDDGSCDKEGT